MKEHYFAVIMAGGGGTRLWPASTREHPKQMLKLGHGKTLFQISVDRLIEIFPFKNIFIVTVADQIQALHDAVPDIPIENFLVEPQPRGTASVVGLAAIHLKSKDPQAVMAVLTADHIIENLETFHTVLMQGEELAHEDLLVTLGIEPTYPATGYGYIEMGAPRKMKNTYNVMQFVEKPDRATAEKYLASKQFLWNSGMFIWQVGIILNEIQKQMPDLAAKLLQIEPYVGKEEYHNVLHEIWPTIHPQTIDYGIMEHAPNVAVIPAREMGWSDIGSWDSLFDLLPTDESKNVIHAEYSSVKNCHNILIHSSSQERYIAAVGLDDLIIVDSENGLLICRKGQSEQVKDIVNDIKDKKLDKFL